MSRSTLTSPPSLRVASSLGHLSDLRQSLQCFLPPFSPTFSTPLLQPSPPLLSVSPPNASGESLVASAGPDYFSISVASPPSFRSTAAGSFSPSPPLNRAISPGTIPTAVACTATFACYATSTDAQCRTGPFNPAAQILCRNLTVTGNSQSANSRVAAGDWLRYTHSTMSPRPFVRDPVTSLSLSAEGRVAATSEGATVLLFEGGRAIDEPRTRGAFEVGPPPPLSVPLSILLVVPTF